MTYFWALDGLQSFPGGCTATGQLSLAIPPCVNAVSTSKSCGINIRTVWCTSPISAGESLVMQNAHQKSVDGAKSVVPKTDYRRRRKHN